MAEYLSLGPVDPNTAMWLRDAVRQDKLPTIKQLNDPKYFPYRWGQAFWAYVGGRYGDDVIRQLLSLGALSGDMDATFKRVLGIDEKQLSSDWQEATRSAYQPILASTMPPNEIGHLAIKAGELGADLNVGPTISPDGKLIAFLSERSFFSTDLFIADADTGKILHRLTSNATNPHFSSIQFIYSAGAWDREGKRIAIATVVGGHPALAVFNAVTGDKQREVSIPDVDEIFNPTWAPDGHAVCFTGMSRGLTDLYVYDLNAGQLKALTHDAYADLQPSWSPDGTRIAFATDRFTSSLETLKIGDYRLALIDPTTGAIEQVRAFTDGKNINPQWSPDGKLLYFISDRDGIPNLYRVAVASGDVAQITNVGTGLSGITSTSPALSVSASAGVASFSVYESGKYDIYTLPLQTPAISDITGVRAGAPSAGALPPLDRKMSLVGTLLADARFGLPVQPTYTAAEYKPRLSLEAVAQPSIGVGASRFGTAIGGGLGLQFSDMLGDHSLGAVVQVNSGFTNNFDLKNTAAQVMYFNQAHRWNWGVVGGQIPYLSGGFVSGITAVGNEPAEVDQTILYRQTERSGAAIVAYPLNRSERLEFQGGVTQISFDQIVQTTTFSLVSGSVLSNDTSTTSLANPLTLGDDDGGVRVRHVELRRDEPGAGAEISRRSIAGLRIDRFHERAGGLPPLLHARAVLHDRDARDALWSLRCWRRGSAAVSAVYRLPESRARIRRRDVRHDRLRPDRRQPMSRIRPARREPFSGRERRVPVPAAAAVRRLAAHVRAGARGSGLLRRRRPGLEQRERALARVERARQRHRAASVRRSRRGGQRRRHAARESVRLRRWPVRFQPPVPAARPRNGLSVQSLAWFLADGSGHWVMW